MDVEADDIRKKSLVLLTQLGNVGHVDQGEAVATAIAYIRAGIGYLSATAPSDEDFSTITRWVSNEAITHGLQARALVKKAKKNK